MESKLSPTEIVGMHFEITVLLSAMPVALLHMGAWVANKVEDTEGKLPVPGAKQKLSISQRI